MSVLGWLAPWWATGLAALALVVALAAAGWHVYDKVTAGYYTAGYNARIAEEAKTAAALQVETSRREQDGAEISQRFQSQLAKTLPPIEEASHETQERVRTIYRDVPVHDCVRPAGVLHELDAARARANAAATAPAD